MSPDEEEEMPPKKKLKSIEQEEKIKTQKRGTGRDIGRTVVLTKLATGLNQNHIRKKCRKIGPVEKGGTNCICHFSVSQRRKRSSTEIKWQDV